MNRQRYRRKSGLITLLCKIARIPLKIAQQIASSITGSSNRKRDDEEKRIQAYLELVQALLTCPEGQEAEILQQNIELVDEGLLLVMKQVAQMIRQEGQEKEAAWLENIAQQIASTYSNLTGENDPWEQVNQQAVKLYQQGKYPEALSLGQQALTLARERWGEEHENVATSLNNLAVLYKSQGRYSWAEPLYLEALDMTRRLFPDDHPHVATSLNNLAGLYDSQGRYSWAEPLYLEALDMLRRLFPDDHPHVASSLNNLAFLYSSQGRYSSAEPLYLEALEMFRRLFPDDHPDVASSLNNLAFLYSSQGDYAKAEPLYLEALEMFRRLFPDDHPDVASSLNNLAFLYSSQGDYAKAEPLYLEALEMFRRLFPDDHPDVASSLNNLAGLYESQGDYAKAEPLYLEALDMRRRLLPDDHPDVASSLNNLAGLYESQGDYAKAEPLYLEALDMRRRLLPDDHPDVASSLNNLAGLYESQGDYAKAEPLYLEALDMRRRLLPDDHPDVASSLNNLAGLYESQGDYAKAEPLYLEALEMLRRLFPDDHPDVASSLNNLAFLYSSQGDYAKAEPLYLEALDMRRRLLPDDHPDVASSLNNLAGLYSSQGDYAKAEPLYLEALEMFRRLFPDDHPDVASSLNNLAALYSSQGRYSCAEPLYLEALEMLRRLFPDDHPDVASSLNNLAALYDSQGDYAKAEPLYLEALEMNKKLLGDQHPLLTTSFNNLATLLLETHRPEEALNYMQQALAVEDRLISRTFATSSESDRLRYIRNIRKNFDGFLSLIHSHLPQAIPIALDAIFKRKGIATAALAARNQAFHSQRYQYLKPQLDKLRALSDEIIHLTFSQPSPQNRDRLQELEKASDNLQRNLAKEIPEMKLEEEKCDCSTIAAALPANSALIEFVSTNIYDFAKKSGSRRYLAFILPNHQPEAVTMVDLGEDRSCHELIGQLHFHLRHPMDLPESVAKLNLNWNSTPKIPTYNPAVAQRLYNRLMAPLQEAIAPYQHLFIAPDDFLCFVPFQLLSVDPEGVPLDSARGTPFDDPRGTPFDDPRGTSFDDPRGTPFDDPRGTLLGDVYRISYLSTARDLLRPQIETPRPVGQPIILADPDYELCAQTASSHTTSEPSYQQQALALWKSTLDEQQLDRAVGTDILGKAVARELNVRPYLQKQALATVLNRNNSPSILLIATHGLYSPASQESEEPASNQPTDRLRANPERDPMLRSGLAFAGANAWRKGKPLPPEAGRGFLFAQDIAQLDLWGNELTVLCACESGMGDIQVGEGVFGMRRAFAVAGAKTLVMSLWSVPARASVLLMHKFFAALKAGTPRDLALKQAQDYIKTVTVGELRQTPQGQEILAELAHPLSPHGYPAQAQPLAHPFYWGAWICQGETTPMTVDS